MEAVKKCLLTSGNRNLLKNLNRTFSVSQANNAKVAVLGASGGIGQPLSALVSPQKLASHRPFVIV